MQEWVLLTKGLMRYLLTQKFAPLVIRLDHQHCETWKQPLKCGTLCCCEVESSEKVSFLFNLNVEFWTNIEYQ